jgi:isoleucyl-tRNA synthetase
MKPVPASIRFPKIENEILEYWQTHDIFQKSLDKNRESKPYIFYDGPPFATGMPHYGHILTSYIKDTIPRYFTMRGRFVDRRWGWDCHGLPIEYEIEKKLGISGKAAIEDYGIDKFNKACSDIVLKYADDWVSIIERIGRWVDFERKYQTMDLDFMESVMWVFKDLYEKGLIYESLKVVAYCNRCQTPLSNFETGLDDSYRDKDDPSVTVTFKDKENQDISYLAWTTTPWTLPSNQALAVNPDIDYCVVKTEKWGKLILAKERIEYYAKQLSDHIVLETVKGKELVGKYYYPLFPFAKRENAFRILGGDFVDTKAGTGIVHMAPSFGDDDFKICTKEGIDIFDPIGLDGKFSEEAGFLKGLDVFEANKSIIRHLKEKGLLFYQQSYRHSYPHCWRCDSPLIYRTISSWYVKVTEFKDKMVNCNQSINWIPAHIKDKRFGQWLEGARDWAISRNRFWGSPIPVWKCDQCDSVVVPGSIKELEDRSGQTIDDLHRPNCDHIVFDCPSNDCSGKCRRVLEVLDCWFESGAMPYAQVHFPFENKKLFEDTFPASFIVEYIAQTRGWFYTLVVEAASVMGKHPFENAICHGVILADDGRKMSKSLKNFPDPMKVVEEHGSDALRIYLLSSAVVKGIDIRFSENGVRESVRRYLIPLWNSFHFFTSYSGFIEEYIPETLRSAKNTEDRHILSELENLKQKVNRSIEIYDLPRCYSHILYFIETLSGWYIRNNRKRFWVTKINEDATHAFNTLYTVLMEVSKICAPFIPFTMDYIYRHFTGESVHLADWPEEIPGRIDAELNDNIKKIRSVIEGGRRIREKNRINLRQPLPLVRVAGIAPETLELFTGLLKSQLNVKKVLDEDKPENFSSKEVQLDQKKLGPVLRKNLKKIVSLVKEGAFVFSTNGAIVVDQYTIDQEDFTIAFQPSFENEDVWFDRELVISLCLEINETLKIEGAARNLNRYIQDLRKKQNLPYDARIKLSVDAEGIYRDCLAAHKEWLIEQSLAVSLTENVETSLFEISDAEGSIKIHLEKEG